jgi:hypothetical protein
MVLKNIPNIDEIMSDGLDQGTINTNRILSPRDKFSRNQTFDLPQPPVINKDLIKPFQPEIHYG